MSYEFHSLFMHVWWPHHGDQTRTDVQSRSRVPLPCMTPRERRLLIGGMRTTHFYCSTRLKIWRRKWIFQPWTADQLCWQIKHNFRWRQRGRWTVLILPANIVVSGRSCCLCAGHWGMFSRWCEKAAGKKSPKCSSRKGKDFLEDRRRPFKNPFSSEIRK